MLPCSHIENQPLESFPNVQTNRYAKTSCTDLLDCLEQYESTSFPDRNWLTATWGFQLGTDESMQHRWRKPCCASGRVLPEMNAKTPRRLFRSSLAFHARTIFDP